MTAKTNNVHSIHNGTIEEAKRLAREAIHGAWPTAAETVKPAEGMYEFDTIGIDDETCPISSVTIMHDPDAETFALVENARTTNPPKEEATQEPVFHFDGPTDWDKLAEDHAIAYLRGDLATSSPESYTIEEMRTISAGMFASTAEVEAAMRRDFQELLSHEQAMMLNLLGKPGTSERDWWERLLLGIESIPDMPPVIE